MLKIVIVILLLGLIASLGSGFYYLMIDQGDKTKRRTMNSLGVRVTLAGTLIAVVAYGLSTGQLGYRSNPLDAVPTSTQAPQ